MSISIAELRREQHLTQRELAAKAGVSYMTVRRLESGYRPQRPFFSTAAVAAALGCSPDDLTQEVPDGT